MIHLCIFPSEHLLACFFSNSIYTDNQLWYTDDTLLAYFQIRHKFRVLCVIIRIALVLRQCQFMPSKELEVFHSPEGFNLVWNVMGMPDLLKANPFLIISILFSSSSSTVMWLYICSLFSDTSFSDSSLFSSFSG